MFSKSVKSGLVAFVMGLALAVPASAATFNIAFTEDGLGDAGADWFGTFEAPGSGGLLTSFSATISGVTYDRLTFAIFSHFAPQYNVGTNSIFAAAGFAIVGSGPDIEGALALQLEGSRWARASCGGDNCGGGIFVGNYSISAVSEVPIPAALPLFAAGLGAMGFMGWRRKRKTLAV